MVAWQTSELSFPNSALIKRNLILKYAKMWACEHKMFYSRVKTAVYRAFWPQIMLYCKNIRKNEIFFIEAGCFKMTHLKRV